MSMSAKTIIKWLETLPEEEMVFIDVTKGFKKLRSRLQSSTSPAHLNVGSSIDNKEETDAIKIIGMNYPIPLSVVEIDKLSVVLLSAEEETSDD